MIGTFPGKLAFADGDEVDVDLEIAAGKLKLVTGISEIGSWPLGACDLEPRPDGSFGLTVDGDTVAFAPDHPDAFSDFVRQIAPYPIRNGSANGGPPDADREPVEDHDPIDEDDLAVTLEALFATEFAEEIVDGGAPQAAPAPAPPAEDLDTSPFERLDGEPTWMDVGELEQAYAGSDEQTSGRPDARQASEPPETLEASDDTATFERVDVAEPQETSEETGEWGERAEELPTPEPASQDTPFGTIEWSDEQDYDIPDWSPGALPDPSPHRDHDLELAQAVAEPEYPDPFAEVDDSWPPSADRPGVAAESPDPGEDGAVGFDLGRGHAPDAGDLTTDDPWAPPEEEFETPTVADAVRADTDRDQGWFRSSVGERFASVAGEIERRADADQEVEGESVADEILAANQQLRAGSIHTRDVKKIATRSVVGVLLVAVVGGLVFLAPRVFTFLVDALETDPGTATETTVANGATTATDATETTAGSAVPVVTAGPETTTTTVAPAVNVFDLDAAGFAARWDEIGGLISPSFELPGAPTAGESFAVSLTRFVALSGTVAADGGLTSYSVTWDTSGDGQDDRFGLNALGVAMAVADPDADGSDLRDRLAALGLDTQTGNLTDLDGTRDWNGVTHHLESNDAGIVTLVLTRIGTNPSPNPTLDDTTETTAGQ
jgi:hypothetical protein